MRRRRLCRIAFAAGCVCAATGARADDITPVCQHMAEVATVRAPRTALNIGAWAERMTDTLPAGMKELRPETRSPDGLARLLGCDSPSACPIADNTTAGNFFQYPNDTVWQTLVVDTRPEGDMLFVFTDHSGHDRCDSFNAFVQSDGEWSLSPLNFGEADAVCDDSGYAILEQNKHAYVAIPPGRASFIDSEPYAPDTPRTEQIAMSIFDPNSQAACFISYTLAPGVTLSRPTVFHVDANSNAHGMTTFFAEHAGDIVKRVAFDHKTPRAAVFRGEDFVQQGTDPGELQNVRDFLASPGDRGDEAIAALLGMQEYFGVNDDTANLRNWVRRLFAVGVEGHAYTAVLLRYDGPGFFFLGPHFFSAALMVLFKTDANGLTPVAYFDVENAYRFVSAEAGSGPAER